jgi:hypothetical protein
MTQTYHYSTVSKALVELNENGFTNDFYRHEENLAKNSNKYKIKHIYRYGGNTDLGDEAVVYGIQSSLGKKGVFVTGFLQIHILKLPKPNANKYKK